MAYAPAPAPTVVAVPHKVLLHAPAAVSLPPAPSSSQLSPSALGVPAPAPETYLVGPAAYDLNELAALDAFAAKTKALLRPTPTPASPVRQARQPQLGQALGAAEPALLKRYVKNRPELDVSPQQYLSQSLPPFEQVVQTLLQHYQKAKLQPEVALLLALAQGTVPAVSAQRLVQHYVQAKKAQSPNSTLHWQHQVQAFAQHVRRQWQGHLEAHPNTAGVVHAHLLALST